MKPGSNDAERKKRLGSALRDNLKKRKAQSRSIASKKDDKSVSLRNRDVAANGHKKP